MHKHNIVAELLEIKYPWPPHSEPSNFSVCYYVGGATTPGQEGLNMSLMHLLCFLCCVLSMQVVQVAG